MKKPRLRDSIIAAREQLAFDDQQMAKHLRMNIDTYSAIVTGSRNLPTPAQRIIERRVERLLGYCGSR